MPDTGECYGGCQDGWTGIDCRNPDVTKSGKQIITIAQLQVLNILTLNK